MTYVLEMRSTADWSDVRYREYTTSGRKADLFRQVPRIKFTDSNHHIVPVVSEARRGDRRKPVNYILRDHVVSSIAAMGRVPRMLPYWQRLEQALRPFVDAYEKAADHISDSDLDNEQPRSVSVTLGDCRRAAATLPEARTADLKS